MAMADYDPSEAAQHGAAAGDEYNFQQADAPDEDDDDYDPSAMEDSADEPELKVPADTTTHALPPNPKTVGGFIVDDDEEDEEQPQQQPNGTGAGTDGAATQDNVIASEPSQEEVASASASAPSTAPVNGSSSLVVPAASVTTDTSSSSFTVPNIATSAPVPSFQSPTDQGKQQMSATASAMQSATATPQPAASAVVAAPPPAQQNGSVPATPTTQRLRHDKVGQLEDRIKEDPKADTEAWRELIKHYREKGQLDNARSVFTRFFEIFPSAAPMWVEYAQMELDNSQFANVEQIFSKCLLQLPNVDMWTTYLDYLRRVHPLVNDPDGTKRGIISQAFELLLEHVGMDPEAGKLWRDYVDFIKGSPGVIGGTGWQDAQKMDLLRKAYQKSIRMPHSELTRLWKEYDGFELGINKATGRKFLQEQSPHYMTARTAKTQMDYKIEGLDRMSLPKLPPLYGCAGEDEFGTQVEKWRSWVEWEKEDPLVLKDEDIAAYRNRIIYVYKQATMQLRFYPTIWFEAAAWCFEQNTEELEQQGEDFLDKGMEACPESVLLVLKKADRVESGLEKGNDDDVAIRNGDRLDEVFEKCHKALYALHKKLVERMTKELAKVQEYFNSLPPEDEKEEQMKDDSDDDAEASTKPQTRAQQQEAQLQAVKTALQHQQTTLKSTISYLWVAKLRAFRRIQGQGQPNKPKKGFRGVFAEARPRGQLTSEVYIASALMEWVCYHDKSAEKIFERGLKLFPTDEVFALEYVRHLVQVGDETNARAVFETTVGKIIKSTATDLEMQRAKCRPLMAYMHEFESCYGDLDRIHKIEERMREMFPDEPELARFGTRFALPSFDGITAQLVISPTQAIPRTETQQNPTNPGAGVAVGEPNSNIRLGPNGPYIASPKRPHEATDSDDDGQRRKFLRAESPLKGAAGRRVHTQNAPSLSGTSAAGGGFVTKNYVPPGGMAGGVSGVAGVMGGGAGALPYEIHRLLSILPPARSYNSTVFDPVKVVGLLSGLVLPRAA